MPERTGRSRRILMLNQSSASTLDNSISIKAGPAFADGSPVTQVDLIGHSMGGLIARAYLSGKSQSPGVFSPPQNHKIRKLITIATPHFGSFMAGNSGAQMSEMVPGSRFLWDLASWNQNTDDLRGVDALAIIGNANLPDYRDDGVVSLTSGSLSFYYGASNERTRTVPYCHTTDTPLSLCFSQGIAYVGSASHQTAQIVRSFLADTTDWQSIGNTPTQNVYLSQYAGFVTTLKDSNDAYVSDLINVDVDNYGSLGDGPVQSMATLFYGEFVPAGQRTVTFSYGDGRQVQGTLALPAGGTHAAGFKYGTLITRVRSVPAGSPGLTVNSGSLIVVNGYQLFSVAPTTVVAGGIPLEITELSDSNISAYLPRMQSGLVRLTVANGNGQHSLNIMTSPSTTFGDIDFDRKADISVWRPEMGVWYSLRSSSPGDFADSHWGIQGDKPVRGDYDGDGRSDNAVWRPSTGTWYVLSSQNGSFTATQWGIPSDVPVPGDYDRDGKTDIAVWRPSSGVWYVLPSNSSGTYTAVQWGLETDIPVPADYDADGRADIAIWRPASGFWYVLLSGSPGAYEAIRWGIPSDLTVPGDYDGDGKNDIAVWRPNTGTWYVLLSRYPGTYGTAQWGTLSDIPTPADFDGDGITDIAVWRPSSGIWYVLPSSSLGSYTATQWGISTDVPISPLTGILRLIP